MGKNRKSGLKRETYTAAIVTIFFLVLAAVNYYASYKTALVVEQLRMPFFGDVHGGPKMLAVILFANGGIFTLLTLKRAAKR